METKQLAPAVANRQANLKSTYVRPLPIVKWSWDMYSWFFRPTSVPYIGAMVCCEPGLLVSLGESDSIERPLRTSCCCSFTGQRTGKHIHIVVHTRLKIMAAGNVFLLIFKNNDERTWRSSNMARAFYVLIKRHRVWRKNIFVSKTIKDKFFFTLELASYCFCLLKVD